MAQAEVLSKTLKAQNWRESYRRFVALFYLFQGVYFVGTTIYIFAALADWGMSATTQVTVVAVVSLPLYLKMLPGLLSDRVPLGRWGRRKPYIFIGGLLYIPGFALLILVQRYGIVWLGAVLLTRIAWMLVDGILDALIVDITPQENSARMQSAAWGSRLLGTALAGLLVPVLGPRMGWTPVVAILGAVALVQTGMALLLREIPVSIETLQQNLPLGRVMREAFGRPLMWASIAFFLLFAATRGLGSLINVFLLTELGWSGSPERMQTYGLLVFVGLLASAVGAFLVGRLPLNLFTSIKLYAGFLVAFWMAVTPMLAVKRFPDNLTLIFGAIIILGFFNGAGTAMAMILVMRVCPNSLEGFTFALMMSVTNFGSAALGPKTAAAFSAQLGLIPSILTLIPYGLLSLVFLYPLLQALDKPTQRAALEPA